MAKVIADSWVVTQSGNIPRAVRFYAKRRIKPSVRMSSCAELKAPGGSKLSWFTDPDGNRLTLMEFGQM